eukprot:747642-Hanusia_phi.AAC.2
MPVSFAIGPLPLVAPPLAAAEPSNSAWLALAQNPAVHRAVGVGQRPVSVRLVLAPLSHVRGAIRKLSGAKSVPSPPRVSPSSGLRSREHLVKVELRSLLQCLE